YIGGKSTRSGVRRYNLLYGGSQRLARTPDLCEGIEMLSMTLNFNCALQARHRKFVHGGVVGWRGRGIVISWPPMSGKTTLVAELVRAGASYYSDEYAVFDVRGHVHPYITPFMVREDATKRPKICVVESLGGRAGTTLLPVGLVLVTAFRVGA